MTNGNDKSLSHTSTTIVAVLTLVVTAIAAIPGFLGLNKEQALIYFSGTTTGIVVPASADVPKIRSILAGNGIPSDQLAVAIVNQGNKEASEVRMSISIPGKILEAWTEPPEASKPIWVQLPDLSQAKGQSQIQTSLKALGITKPVTIYVGYEKTSTGVANVELFSDGRPGVRVQDVSAVPAWSPVDIFKLPLFILGGGVAFVVLWAMGVVISRNPKMKAALTELVIKSIRELAKGFFPFIRL